MNFALADLAIYTGAPQNIGAALTGNAPSFLTVTNFALAAIALIGIVATVVLWISALVSVFRNPTIEKNSKVLWFLLIFLVNPIGAIIYFFMHGYKTRAWLIILAFIMLILPLILFPFLMMRSFPDKVKIMNGKVKINQVTNPSAIDVSDQPSTILNLIQTGGGE